MSPFLHRFTSATRSYGPWLLIIGIVFVGSLLLAAGVIVDLWKYDQIWSKLLFAGGSAILAGGVSAVVLKLLAIEGYFLDAVAKQMLSENYLNKASRFELEQLWHEVTSRIYLPHLRTEQEKRLTHFVELEKEIQSRVTSKFKYSAEFYVDQIEREISINWATKNENLVELVELSHVRIIPFDPAKKLQWAIKTSVERGDDDIVKLDTIDFCRFEDGTDVPHNVELSNIPGEKLVTFKPPIRDDYVYTRQRRIRWDVRLDPEYEINSPYVVRNFRLRIDNNLDDMMLILSGVNGASPICIRNPASSKVWPAESTILKNDKGVLLPEDTFRILIVPFAK